MAPITAITNVRVFDGQKISDLSTVIIDGELITESDAIPTHTIDAEGAILLPGLIDCHIHLHGPDDLSRMAEYGVTTALDMATWPAKLLASLRNMKGVTDIRGCGIAATAPGSAHSHIPFLPRDALVSNASEAKRFVADRIAEGADYIKMVADAPGPNQETLDALVENAHQNNKLVIAHAVSLIATRMSQNAGTDFITHAPLDGIMSEKDIQRMVSDKCISIPTLTMMKGVSKSKDLNFDNARKTVAALHLAGVPILAGTDANMSPGVPANVAHGISLHEELELLVGCGLSTTEVLRAATSLPAKYFGLHDRGVIQPGYRADLILVKDDPTQDIKGTRSLQRVWIAGQEIKLSQA
ncbi:hypothetical protein N7478_003877 [Penicillium angulare]|uniref:uncharacterized protein n=1 Tax=Penicillium angulare TaxID=116970 RepID=UPI002540296A|nr:uncharacterized protein N7478_003877 [Penicillium angulare]KAJ5288191.1 hypothetical protein N7478_003877 [Penicillium angulare]